MASMLAGCSLTGSKIKPTADTVILLWMAGGMAHTETFDPKHYEPYKKGMDANGVLSTFPSIPTSVDGVSFSEVLESIASVMDRATLIRSYVAADMGCILQARLHLHCPTCYEPPQTVYAPHFSSCVAKDLGPQHTLHTT